MEESFDPAFFTTHLSGQASEMKPMVNLMAQVFVILVIGIVLWRISAIFGKKGKSRKRSMFSDSRFDSWKK